MNDLCLCVTFPSLFNLFHSPVLEKFLATLTSFDTNPSRRFFVTRVRKVTTDLKVLHNVSDTTGLGNGYLSIYT